MSAVCKHLSVTGLCYQCIAEQVRAIDDGVGKSEHAWQQEQIEALKAENARLRESAEASAHSERIANIRIGDLAGENATLRSRTLGEAELYHKITCPQCKHEGTAKLRTATVWQVAPGIAVVTEQLRELREAAEAACKGWGDYRYRDHLEAVLAKVRP